MNHLIKDYFSFEKSLFFDERQLMACLNEAFILEGEEYLNEQGIDTSNIYFKLLAQLQTFKNQEYVNDSVIAHINYLIGYYIGLFLHPMEGDFLAIEYLNSAISLEKDPQKVEEYQTVIAMIRGWAKSHLK